MAMESDRKCSELTGIEGAAVIKNPWLTAGFYFVGLLCAGCGLIFRLIDMFFMVRYGLGVVLKTKN